MMARYEGNSGKKGKFLIHNVKLGKLTIWLRFCVDWAVGADDADDP